MDLQVQKIHQLPFVCLTDLVRESQESDFRAMQRLVDDWNLGTNRFDRLGEALFVAQFLDRDWQNRIVGVCGLNIDPYLHPCCPAPWIDSSVTTTATKQVVGRVRRLYVMQLYRRQGIGRALVERIITEARLSFSRLHVRTDSKIADRFYRSLGFVVCPDNPYVSHSLNLSKLDLSQ